MIRGRGANTLCTRHPEKLICSNCAEKLRHQKCPTCNEDGVCVDSDGDNDIFECINHHNWSRDSKTVEMDGMMKGETVERRKEDGDTH